MAELLKVYPKDISMIIEVPLNEMESLLDYLERAEVSFDKIKEFEFQKTVDQALSLIKSFNDMCNSVRNIENVS